MTTPEQPHAEQVAEARRLRAVGRTYPQIADELAVGVSTAYRWCNPDAEEQGRAACRRWKQRNRERCRAYDREHRRRGECAGCGRATHEDCASCMSCRREEKEARWALIEKWWADGLTVDQIAARRGVTRGCVWQDIHRARVAGRNVPYRYNIQGGKRCPES